MTKETFLFNLIQTIGLLTPTLIILYNLGKYRGKTDQILMEHTKDIDGVGKKVANIREEQADSLAELKAQVDNISTTLAKVTTSIQYIEKHIDELRAN